MTIYDYRISTGGTAVNGTGNLSVSLGGTAVTGAGTAFLTEVAVGDLLFSTGGFVASVLTITNDTALTLAAAATVALTTQAFTIDHMVTIESLATKATAPRGEYQPWATSIPTGDGLARGMGRPIARWRWDTAANDYMLLTLRTALRVYCTGKSARVYIRTRTFDNSDAFRTFQAAMIWPDKEEREMRGVRRGFVIEFRDLVQL